MDSNKPEHVSSPPSSSMPPGVLPTIPLGMPPGMSSDNQAELKKANWVLGLGIASFLCTCFTFIPALIIGFPLVMSAQSPEAKSRAKIGLALGGIALALSLLLSAVWSAFLTTTLQGKEKDLLRNFGQEKILPFKESKGPKIFTFDGDSP